MTETDRVHVVTRRRGLQLLTAAAASGLLAASQQTAQVATAAPTVVSMPSSQASAGGAFVTQLGADPTMNPVVGPDYASNVVNAAIFNQLTRVDKDTLQPRLTWRCPGNLTQMVLDGPSTCDPTSNGTMASHLLPTT
ncbi:MAG: hypothetical protein JO318_01840 [Chloroflexi bacterium]|nr:hypothetical protein [Chloroflexota bacterium]